MAYELLFGNRIEPACKYCRDGYPGGRANEYMCARHGIVFADHKCRHFIYDPISRIPKRPLPLEKYDKDAFTIE